MSNKEYVIARSKNKAPTVQHRLLLTDPTFTVCGLDITKWPWRHYSNRAFSVMLCLRCERRTLGD